MTKRMTRRWLTTAAGGAGTMVALASVAFACTAYLGTMTAAPAPGSSALGSATSYANCGGHGQWPALGGNTIGGYLRATSGSTLDISVAPSPLPCEPEVTMGPVPPTVSVNPGPNQLPAQTSNGLTIPYKVTFFNGAMHTALFKENVFTPPTGTNCMMYVTTNTRNLLPPGVVSLADLSALGSDGSGMFPTATLPSGLVADGPTDQSGICVGNMPVKKGDPGNVWGAGGDLPSAIWGNSLPINIV